MNIRQVPAVGSTEVAGDGDSGGSAAPSARGSRALTAGRLAALGIPFAAACVLLFVMFYRDARNTAVVHLQNEQRVRARLAVRGVEELFGEWIKSLTVLAGVDGIIELNDEGRRALQLFLEQNEHFRSITRMDAQGTILASYPSTGLAGVNISSQPHVRALLRDRRWTVSDVFHAVQGYDAIAIHVPVFGGHAFKGSLAVVVNFESVAAHHFDMVRFGETGHTAVVVSRDGTLLYIPEAGLTGKPAQQAYKDLPSGLAMLKEMLKGREGFATYEVRRASDGSAEKTLHYYAAYMPIRLGSTYWSLAMASSEQDLLVDLTTFRNRLALIVGLAFTGALLISILFVRAKLILGEQEKRRRAEEAARSSERLQATMYDVSPEALFYVGIEPGGSYRFVSVNPAFLRVTGLTETQVVGRAVEDVIPHPSLGIVVEKYGTAIASRQTITWEETSAYPTGTRYGEVSVTPVFGADGTCANLFGTVHDLTDQREAEAALRKSEQRYRMLFEHGPQPAIVVDDGTDRVVAANTAAIQQFGYDSAELLTKSVDQIIADEDKQRVALGRRHNVPLRKYSDLLLRRGDGSVFAADVASSAVEYEDRPSRFVVITDMTERFAAKQELQEAKQFHEEIVSSAGEGIVAFDRELRVSVWNAFMEQLTETPAGEITGKPLDAVLPLLHGEAAPELRNALECGERRTTEFSIVLGGKDCWLRQVAVPHRGKAGQTLGVIAIISDITPQKQAEGRLRASEELLRSIIEATPSFVFTLDLDRRFTSVNPALCRAVQRSEEELIGRGFWELGIVPDDPGQWSSLADHVFKSGKPTQFVTKFTLRDGRDLIVEGTFSPLFDEESAIRGLSAITLDVTDRLRAAETVKRLAQAVAQASEVIYMTDRRGVITYANPAFESVYGFSQSEILGNTPRVLKSGLTPPAENERFWKSILAGNSVHGEIVNKRKDGTLVTVDRSVTPVFDAAREVVGFLSVQTDITGRKRMEAEQEELRARMVQVGKMEAIGTLAGGIAHDFNNILSVILSYTTVLERTGRDEQTYAKAVGTIRQAVHRGADLAKQVLTFARRSKTTPTAVNVNDTVAEIAKMLRATFPRTITFDLALAKTLPPILADASQLHQAFLNLFINAGDAMPSGGIIRVSTGVVSASQVRARFPDAHDSSYVGIQVTDTGTGMPEEVLEHIFEPFFTTKGEGRGTGLGLAVTYGTVRTAGGFIDVQSEEGKGTVFDIFLPVPLSGGHNKAGDSERVTDLSGTETVLFVEDEPDLGPLMVENLRHHGYTALLARDGSEALQLFGQERRRIDIIVCDDNLPQMTGRDLFTLLRDRLFGAPFILASGFVEPDVLYALRRAGVRQFLQKPYAIDDLLTSIRSALDHSPAGNSKDDTSSGSAKRTP